MTFSDRSNTVQAAMAHLVAASGFRTKDEGSPVELVTRKFGDFTADMVKRLGATDTDLAELSVKFSALEQKVARSGGSGEPYHAKTFGEQFVENVNVKNWLDGDPSGGRADVRFKATLTTATTAAAGSVGATTTQIYRDSIVTTPRRRPTVRDLLSVVQISSGSVEWPSQSGRTASAAPVAETVAKPESDVTFEMKTANARVIAHWMKASKQVLSDSPQLRGIIDTELLQGLELAEENQLLNGDGTGQNLLGLIPQATAFTASGLPSLGDVNIIDMIALAALQVANAFYEADGAVINAGDFLAMRTLKDAQGQYILGSPIQNVAPVLWGIPLVSTSAMSSGKMLVGAFKLQTIFDRWDARIETGFVTDDFIKNLVTILAEERLALGVKAPGALIYGDLGGPV